MVDEASRFVRPGCAAAFSETELGGGLEVRAPAGLQAIFFFFLPFFVAAFRFERCLFACSRSDPGLSAPHTGLVSGLAPLAERLGTCSGLPVIFARVPMRTVQNVANSLCLRSRRDLDPPFA